MAYYRASVHLIFDFEAEESEAIKIAKEELDKMVDGKIIQRKTLKIDKLRDRIHKVKIGEFKPDEVLRFVGEVEKREFTVNGKSYIVKMDSPRYYVFKANLHCVACGIEGIKMILEKTPTDLSPHFNLYAGENGRNVLMTKDHIVPKSRGGENNHTNYQTMCSVCNNLKGSSDITLEALKELRKVFEENRKLLPRKKLRDLIAQHKKKLKNENAEKQ